MILFDGHEYGIKLNLGVYRESFILSNSFSNSLIIRTLNHSRYEDESVLLQYSLLNGKLYYTEVKYTKFSEICSDSRNLYVVTSAERKETHNLSISVLNKTKNDEALKISKTQNISVLHHESQRNNTNLIYFSFSDNKRLSICYKFITFNYEQSLFDSLHNDVYIITISIKTMNTICNKKLSECVKFGTGGPYTQKECIKKIMDYNFEVLFVLRKTKKSRYESYHESFFNF